MNFYDVAVGWVEYYKSVGGHDNYDPNIENEHNEIIEDLLAEDPKQAWEVI